MASLDENTSMMDPDRRSFSEYIREVKETFIGRYRFITVVGCVLSLVFLITAVVGFANGHLDQKYETFQNKIEYTHSNGKRKYTHIGVKKETDFYIGWFFVVLYGYQFLVNVVTSIMLYYYEKDVTSKHFFHEPSHLTNVSRVAAVAIASWIVALTVGFAGQIEQIGFVILALISAFFPAGHAIENHMPDSAQGRDTLSDGVPRYTNLRKERRNFHSIGFAICNIFLGIMIAIRWGDVKERSSPDPPNGVTWVIAFYFTYLILVTLWTAVSHTRILMYKIGGVSAREFGNAFLHAWLLYIVAGGAMIVFWMRELRFIV